MSNLLKNLLFALGLAVLLWLGYWFFMRNAPEDSALVTDTAGAELARQQAQDFTARLNELESMSVDTKVLSDVRFVSLVNFRQPLLEEPVGRSNPFAPLE